MSSRTLQSLSFQLGSDKSCSKNKLAQKLKNQSIECLRPTKKNIFWPSFKAPLKKTSLNETRFVYFCTILFIFPGKCQAFPGKSQDS